MKDKAFARAVRREDIIDGAAALGVLVLGKAEQHHRPTPGCGDIRNGLGQRTRGFVHVARQRRDWLRCSE